MPVQLSPDDYVSLPQLIDQIGYCLSSRTPFSLIRLGDGELMVLAQELVFDLEWISRNVPWGNSNTYCGVSLPNLTLRDRMMDAIAAADVVGVFADDEFTHQVLNAVDIQPKSICYAFQNLYMPMFKPFVDLIRYCPPLLVGRPAEQFALLLYEKLGVVIPGTVTINGYEEIDTCIDQMSAIPHTWSLVSAGCNATVICTAMAERFGKVSIDFGHAPDNAMRPDYPQYWLNTD